MVTGNALGKYQANHALWEPYCPTVRCRQPRWGTEQWTKEWVTRSCTGWENPFQSPIWDSGRAEPKSTFRRRTCWFCDLKGKLQYNDPPEYLDWQAPGDIQGAQIYLNHCAWRWESHDSSERVTAWLEKWNGFRRKNSDYTSQIISRPSSVPYWDSIDSKPDQLSISVQAPLSETVNIKS